MGFISCPSHYLKLYGRVPPSIQGPHQCKRDHDGMENAHQWSSRVTGIHIWRWGKCEHWLVSRHFLSSEARQVSVQPCDNRVKYWNICKQSVLGKCTRCYRADLQYRDDHEKDKKSKGSTRPLGILANVKQILGGQHHRENIACTVCGRVWKRSIQNQLITRGYGHRRGRK